MQELLTYSELSEKLLSENINVFLVSGKSLEKTGFLGNFERADKVKFVRFSDFSENPYLEEVAQGVKAFKESKAKIIMAVGGGTAIDLAKLIRFYADAELTGKESEPPANITSTNNCQLIAVPTTFGTGSEATHFAVLYVKGKKFSVADDSILPDFYLMDAGLAKSLPKHVKASACLDALCQAIESYWSVAKTAESQSYALEAIKCVRLHYDAYIKDSSDESEVSKCIAKAAHLAGKAINITKTTAPHAISYTLTSKFNVPHGHAVALCLRNMFLINEKKSTSEDLISSHQDIYSALQVDDAISAKKLLDGFMMLGRLEVSLAKLGILTESDIEMVVKGVNFERLANHPVELDYKDIVCVLTN